MNAQNVNFAPKSNHLKIFDPQFCSFERKCSNKKEIVRLAIFGGGGFHAKAPVVSLREQQM